MPIKDGHLIVGPTIGSNFATPVDGHGHKQEFHEIWPGIGHLVVYGHGTDEAGASARLSAAQAHETNNVTRIGVIVLAFGRLVDTCGAVGR